eukprot:3475100-Rhodomonas_salina.2
MSEGVLEQKREHQRRREEVEGGRSGTVGQRKDEGRDGLGWSPPRTFRLLSPHQPRPSDHLRGSAKAQLAIRSQTGRRAQHLSRGFGSALRVKVDELEDVVFVGLEQGANACNFRFVVSHRCCPRSTCGGGRGGEENRRGKYARRQGYYICYAKNN